MSNIMVIDDTPANLDILAAILRGAGYQVRLFPRGASALHSLDRDIPDLILLDIVMPGMDGFAVCAELKTLPSAREIPVIFLSALNETSHKVKAFAAGGVDYITKPFQQEEVLARVHTHLSIRHLQQELERHAHHLEELVQEKVREIQASQMATLQAISSLAEFRDLDTALHTERTSIYCRSLAEQLRADGLDYIDEAYLDNIYHAAPLHDIGKIGIPDHILLKPGKLTPEEFATMKTHVDIGLKTLRTVLDKYPGNAFIKMGLELTGTHHERWDGTGYPGLLKGEDIPLSGRIMALADVYDALRSARPYKESYPHGQCVSIIESCSGSHFDPRVVQAFKARQLYFCEISEKMKG